MLELGLHVKSYKRNLEYFFLFTSLFPMKNLQHSLVTEIRDLIYPEDRLRFDELMFRHGITVNVCFNFLDLTNQLFKFKLCLGFKQ